MEVNKIPVATNAANYNSMPVISDAYFERTLSAIKQDMQPVDAISVKPF